MLFFLPLLPAIALFLIASRGNADRRHAFLVAATVWGLLLTAITEVLSLAEAITFAGLAVAWLLVLIATAGAWMLGRPRTTRSQPKPASKPGPKRKPARLAAIPHAALVLVMIGLLVGLTGLVALVAAPNNYDSMTYHMARVAHWAQDRSVAHFPTHLQRQIHQNPWAEFAILHFQVLGQGDRWANLVQWFSMLGSIAGITLIAQQLGVGARGQLLAAGLCASLPMGVLQASTTQNDYVLAFWMVCMVSFFLAAMATSGRPQVIHLMLASIALGLAVLSKGTAYLFALPFVIWTGLALLKQLRWKALAPFLLMATIPLAINVGHYARNDALYGTPIGPGGEQETGLYRYANDVFGPRVFLSNVLRNLAIETAVPIKAADRATEGAVRGLHRLIGANPDDPRTTFTEQNFWVRGNFWNSENVAANPGHFALLIWALIVIPRWKQLPMRERRRLIAYGAALVAGFLLFCFYLRWQPWHCRLHLPLLVLGCALIGLAMEQKLSHGWSIAIVVALQGVAVFVIATSLGRPMVGPSSIFAMERDDQYFLSSPGAARVYKSLAAGVAARGAQNIGLVMGVNDYEYPLWVLIQRRNPRARIEHVEVTNTSKARAAVPPWSSFAPQVVIHIDGRKNIAKIEDVAAAAAPDSAISPRSGT